MALNQQELRETLEGLDSSVATREVPVPELGGKTLLVREMSGSLRNAFESWVAASRAGAASPKELDQLTLRIVRECVVNEELKPIVTAAMAQQLFDKQSKAVFRLRDAVIEVSALNEEDVDALTEEIEADPFEGSPSD